MKTTPDNMALRRLGKIWKPRTLRLAAGIFIALLAVCASLTLMGQAGSRIAAAAIGVVAGSLLLKTAGAAQIGLRYTERLYTHDAMFRALSDLRVWFYRRLARGAAAGLGFRRSADLLSRLVTDIQTLDNLYLRIIIPLFSALLTLPVVTIIWLKTGVIPAILASTVFIILVLVLPWMMVRFSRKSGPDILHAQSGLQVAALDLTSGLREVRAFGAENTLTGVIADRQEALFKAQHRQAIRMALANGCAGLLAKLGIAIILCAVTGLFFRQTTPIIGISALFVALTAFESVTGLSRAGLLYGQVSSAAERILDVTDQPPATPSGNTPLPTSHEIQIRDVTFRWSAERPTVFENLSLTLREGERVALIGPSGAGKSSLAALLLKAAMPEKGQILLGGEDITTLQDDALRSRIAWLSQSSHLFDDTIRGNLTLGRTDITDSALWSALEQAQIADTVRGLPDGLETWIGESGSKLSGGQGRRIALARILLSNAPVLVLDEPATGLDADTEKAFLQTLNSAGEGRSVLLITHRLTGVETLDRIWRLEDGHIVSTFC